MVINYAAQAQRYWEMAELEEIAANERKAQVLNKERARLERMRQWNPMLRGNTRFELYVESRAQAALRDDTEYNNHLSMQRHYLRKAQGATNLAHLHGHTLIVFEEEEENGI